MKEGPWPTATYISPFRSTAMSSTVDWGNFTYLALRRRSKSMLGI